MKHKTVYLERQDNTTGIVKAVFLTLLSGILFFPPFVRGLFFEREQFVAEAFIFGVFILYWGYKLLTKDKRFIKTPVELASLGLMLIYLLCIVYAVSTRDALSEALKYCMYFSVFFMLSDILSDLKLRKSFLWFVSGVTALLCLVGIDGAAGAALTKGINQVLKSMGTENNLFFDLFKEGRIYSSLQYPNALASYVIAVFIIITALGAVNNNRWIKGIAGAMGSLFFLTFILTLSRGAYILVPLAGILLLLALPKGGRLRGLTFGFIPAVVSIIFAVLISPAMGQAGQEAKVWILTLGGMTTAGLLSWAYSYISGKLEKISWKIYLSIFAALIILAGIGAVITINTDVPLVMEHSDTEPDSSLSVQKTFTLEKGRNYALQLKVNASSSQKKPYIYQITIISKNIKDILSNGQVQLAALTDTGTTGEDIKTIDFTVPRDSEAVMISFSNYYQGTKAIFSDAVIIDKSTNQTVKRLKLNYKYIPGSIAQRFENLGADQSTILRQIYLGDAGKIIKDRWLLGGGGKAWEKLYFTYQSYGYSSTQAHNYFVQVAVEIGIVGIFLLLLLIFAIIYMYVKNYHKGNMEERILQASLFTAILSMLAHSALDFDFSLSAVFLLFWQLLAVYNSSCRYDADAETDTGNGRNTLPGRVLTWVYGVKMQPVIAIVITGIILYFPIAFRTAISFADAYENYGKANNVSLAVTSIEKAAQLDPLNSMYNIKYLGHLLSKKDVSQDEMDRAAILTEKIEKASTYDAVAATNYAISLLTSGNINKGLEYLELGCRLRPHYLAQWNARLDAYSQMAAIKYSKGDLKGALALANQGLSVLKEATEANRDSVVPFSADMKTMTDAEKLNIIADNAKNDKKVDVNKILFYNISSMDINLDGLPDQWTMDTPAQVKLETGAEGMMVAGQGGYIQSRQLSFAPGKKYLVEVELKNTTRVDIIPFLITDVMSKDGLLEYKDGRYSTIIDLSGNTAAITGGLRLQLPGGCLVKRVVVKEAE